MEITFLIGNGFDLNLGLDTTYSSFVKEYVSGNKNDAQIIKDFKAIIKHNIEYWSAAELAFGQLTNDFNNTSEGVQNFSDCHIDFCENLAKYLQRQEERINFEDKQEYIKNFFRKSLNRYLLGLREEQQNILARIRNYLKGGDVYNFINFNYTTTLDKFISYINNSVSMGSTIFGGDRYFNKIGKVYHVHGTTTKDMVFGVNDSSQIANIKLFEGQPEVYKDQIIKKLTNKMYEERTDEKVSDVLRKSHLIYIYGMSIGETDAMWWELMSLLMVKDSNLHVIIQAMDVPKNELIRIKFVQFENSIRDRFVSFSKLSDNDKNNIKPRIHVVGENIFKDFDQFALRQENLQNILTQEDKISSDKRSA